MAYEPIAPYAIRQFDVEIWVPLKIFGWDISFTNIGAAMLATSVLSAAFFLLSTRKLEILPSRLQAFSELIYEFVAKTVISNGGPGAKPHIPFVFTLFVFILLGTLIGLSPMKETFTTHLIITLTLAIFVFVYVVEAGLRHTGALFFRQFLPAGTPAWLAPMIVFVELVSYLARPITLGVRLFANMLGGHILIKMFGDFAAMMVVYLGPLGIVTAIAPVAMMILLFAFEIMVVFIQSYIFIVLTSVYIRSSIEAH